MDDVYDCWIAVEVTSGAQDGCYAQRSDCYEVCDFLETRYPFTTWLAMLVPGDQRAKVDVLPADSLYHRHRLSQHPRRPLQ